MNSDLDREIHIFISESSQNNPELSEFSHLQLLIDILIT